MIGPVDYDPGSLPELAPPRAGETIELLLDGWPPWKDEHFSIRNRRHKIHGRFVALRRRAAEAMKGRAWYAGAVGLDLEVHGPAASRGQSLNDYLGGVIDSLDGSHGQTFTFLPVCYQDDGQVAVARSRFVEAARPRYKVTVRFLGDELDEFS
jgi:hypothetical protein